MYLIEKYGNIAFEIWGKNHDHLGEHLLEFHKCMHRINIDHEDVLIKMFRFSLEGHAREWCRTLLVASIHSLNDFHIAFNNHCKQGYGNDLLYEECCMEFDLLYRKCVNLKDQSVGNQEIIEHEIVPYDLKQGFNDFQTDLFSQESGVHTNNQVFEVSSAAIFPNFYGFEKMSTLAINHEDQMSLSQISLEIFQNTENNLQQPPVLQTIEINNNYEVENTQIEHREEIVVFDAVEVYLKDFISLNCVLFSSEQKDRRICTTTDFAHELFYLVNQ